MNFSTFNLDQRIVTGIETLGYKVPTPIQEQSIPAILAGRDLIGLAQTGTGKTAAFLLPILQQLIDKPRGRVHALILVPTRALAKQIFDVLGQLGQNILSRSGNPLGLRGLTLYGGEAIQPQIDKLKRGVEIVIACPGRLLDHMDRSVINLSHVGVLVVDEADQMFDMGFLPDICKILKQLPKRQSLLFSATMPRPVCQLAETMLNNPTKIQVDHGIPAPTVVQILYPVPEHLKITLLHKILEQTPAESVLIFTRTKQRAKHLARQLTTRHYKASSFQGNLSQNQREATLARFRNGLLNVLVATDMAARGIDINRVSHVINFDMPATVETYTHRVGRTGRANKKGCAFTLITKSDIPRVRVIERSLKQKLEQHYLPDFDYAAPLLAAPLAMKPGLPPSAVRRSHAQSTKGFIKSKVKQSFRHRSKLD